MLNTVLKSIPFTIVWLATLLYLPSTSAAETLQMLAPGVWRVAGDNAVISLSNQGAIVNTGIIATGDGVIVIDPGPSLHRGLAIDAIVKGLTKEPVRWIIDTHAHPENVLGNSAFPQATVIASKPAAELMQSRCRLCLERLTAQLGQESMAGTSIELPTRLVKNGESIQLGRRQLRFLVFARAHTRGDLAVVMPTEKILFAGGLVNDRRVADLHEATLSGWIKALSSLQENAFPVVVPGHGEATDSGVIERFAAYLVDLRNACDADIANGGNAASSGGRLTLPRYRDWVDYAAQHPLNVGHAYREREDAQLQGEPSDD